MAKMEERSAGVITYRRVSCGREYLLLQHREGHWGFPKGHIEDENPKQAARRELQEETGLSSISLVQGFRGLMEYRFERGGELIQKRVICFLGKSDQGEVELSEEHLAFAWLSYDQALNRLTYENSRALLRQAEQFLSGS